MPQFLTREQEIQLVKIAQRGIRAGAIKPKTKPQAKRLKRLIKLGIEARNRVILNIIPLIIRQVGQSCRDKRYAHEQIDDMVNESVATLCKVFHQFDLKRRYRFITFAHAWIWQTITRYKMRDCIIPTPQHHHYENYQDSIIQQTRARYKRYVDAARLVKSINYELEGYAGSKEPTSLQDMIVGKDDNPLYDPDMHDWLRLEMSRLDERSRWILQQRSLKRSLKECGLELGITKERVRQIEFLAVRQLQKRAGVTLPIASQ